MLTLTLVNAILDVLFVPLTIIGSWFMFKALDGLLVTWTRYKNGDAA